MGSRLLVSLVAWQLVAISLSVQPETAGISGRVLDDVNQPVPLALVTVVGNGLKNSRSTLTNEDGYYSIANLPPGRVTLSAAKPAYVPSAYGSKRPFGAGTPIQLNPRDHLTGLGITLARGGVITGTVSDYTGEPVSDVEVTAIPVGATIQRRTNFGRSSVTRTDERGQYRLFGLAAGQYVVAAQSTLLGAADIAVMSDAEVDAALRELKSPALARVARRSEASNELMPSRDNFRAFGWAPTFFPGTAEFRHAVPVEVTSGTEKDGTSFSVLLVPEATIRGTLVSVDASVVPPMTVTLSQGNAAGRSSPVALSMTTRAGASGSFMFRGVPPGTYDVIARPVALDSITGGPGPVLMWAKTQLTVDGGEDSDLSLRLRTGLRLAGQVQLESTAPASNISPPIVTIVIELRTEGMPAGTPRPRRTATTKVDGAFEIAGLLPGAYDVMFRVESPRPWAVHSFIFHGRDWFDTGSVEIQDNDVLDTRILLSDRFTRLAGTLMTESSTPAPEYFIVAFPVDRSQWRSGSRRMQWTRPGNDGHYEFSDIPAGDYFVGVITELVEDEWTDAEFLEAVVPASVRLRLVRGETKLQELRIK